MRAILSAICVCAALAALTATPASAGTPQYPDLKMQSPFDMHLWVTPVNGEDHHFLHLATNLANVGEGAFEVDRVPTASGIADLVQRVYESPAGFRDERIGAAVIDASNARGFPVPYLARFELWTERAYRRAAARQFTRGAPLYTHDGIGYCVLNYEALDPDNTVHVPGWVGPPYVGCTPTTVGISAGWLHRQSWFDDNQWIDLGPTPLPDGEYVVRAIADPTNRLFESPGKADPSREGEVANAGVSYIRIVAGQLAGVDPVF